MKPIIAILFMAVSASASPYFRPLDVRHPQPVLGALIDPSALGKTSAAELLPLVTHSPSDGCLLPSIVCEDWSPLAVGLAMNAGQVTFDIGPIGNVLPWMSALVPQKYAGLLKQDGQKITFSAGPMWEYRQIENKGYFRVFTGLALHF